MKVDITHLLQIINFSSPFRRFEIKNSLCRPIMVANNILNLEPSPPSPPPPDFSSFLRAWVYWFDRAPKTSQRLLCVRAVVAELFSFIFVCYSFKVELLEEYV